ncbi:MAG TPA: hypothetical protein VFZ59_21955 [Verrucomicrobiae bacterium]|nr:hypothetical protein [Verrucomicrobiae bacterium]
MVPETDSRNTTASKRSDALFWLTTLAGIGLMVVLFSLFDLKWLHTNAQKLSRELVFALTVILPLLGAPVSVLYALAGAKFGAGWGLALTLVAIALHLIASWWITHSWLKRPLEAVLRKLGRRIPKVPPGESVPVCLLVALLPGASYALKNYLLVLAGVPFRPFFWTLLPSHFVHAALAILFGDFTGAMTTPRIIFLSAYALVVIGLGHHVVQRLKRHKRAELNGLSHSNPRT